MGSSPVQEDPAGVAQAVFLGFATRAKSTRISATWRHAPGLAPAVPAPAPRSTRAVPPLPPAASALTVGAQRVSARTHVLACAPPRGGAGRFVSASACVLLGRVTAARRPSCPSPTPQAGKVRRPALRAANGTSSAGASLPSGRASPPRRSR